MAYLLDTNVLSESVRPAPNAQVVGWMVDNAAQLYTSAFSIAEIHFGIELLQQSRKKTRLSQWLGDLQEVMVGRILRFDTQVALVWGSLQARLQRTGSKMQTEDSYIAAIALHHGLTVATGNTRDFDRVDVQVFNPFQGTSA
jgi:predicted nucleic acid-binding protein